MKKLVKIEKIVVNEEFQKIHSHKALNDEVFRIYLREDEDDYDYIEDERLINHLKLIFKS